MMHFSPGRKLTLVVASATIMIAAGAGTAAVGAQEEPPEWDYASKSCRVPNRSQ